MRSLILVCFFFIALLNKAQDEFGIAHSNYAPTKTFLQNPTNTLDNKTWIDINLIGAGTFINNNYAYISATRFSFLNNIILGEEWADFEFNTSDRNKQGFQDTDLQLMSAAYQYKEHGFAFSTRLRTYFDFRRVPNEIAALLAEGANGYDEYYDQINNVERAFMNQTSWFEIAGSYSNTFYHFSHETMAAGVTAKYLIGITGAGVQINNAEFNIQNQNNALFYNFEGSTAYASEWQSGTGFAIDLGFVYKKTLHNVTHYEPYSEASACEPYDYKLKLAAAIIDLGYINFNKEATRYDVTTTLTPAILTGDEFTFNGFGEFANNQFNEVVVTDEFRMLTPAALNLQLDYNLENNYFVSAQLMQGFFRRNALGVKRPDILAISGRYQRKWFEASAVLSTFNYQRARVGTALRFGYLTVGTDKLISMFGFRDFYGTDVYFNLRFFLTKKPGCKRKDKDDSKRNSADCVKN